MHIINDKNPVCNAVLYDHGAHGIKMDWNCYGEKPFQILGFLICYMVGDQQRSCLEMIESMGEDVLVSKVEGNKWIYDEEDNGFKIASVNYCSMPEGFSVLNQIFKAPCKIAIWALAKHNDEICVFTEERIDCTCFRKMLLKKDIRQIKNPEIRGGFLKKKVIQPASTDTVVKVSLTNMGASFVEGAVGYRVPGCRYMFPIAEEALGKDLMIKNVSDVAIEIHHDFYNIYEFTD